VFVAFVLLAGCDRFMGAEDRIARAHTQFDAGNYGAAMKEAKVVLDKEPENARAHVLLARVSLRLGDPEAASKSLERARAAGAEPGSIQELHYRVLLAQRRFQDVLTELESDTKTPQLTRLMLTGEAHGALGHAEEAGKAIEQASALAPADPEVSLLRARWLLSSGKADDARKVVDQLLEAQPDMAAAASLRARLAMSVGDAKAARADFERARRSAVKQLDVPEQLAILTGLIECELQLGDTTQAETHIKQLHDRIPDAFVTYYLKARLALQRNDATTATDLLRDAVTRQPDNVSARLLLAATLVQQGSMEQADAELSKILAEHPENVEARKLLAKVYVARNDMAGARRILDQGPAGGARDSQLDWLDGSIRLMTGETDEAIALLETSAAANPRNIAMQLDLAQAYLMAGRGEQAQQVLHALSPGDRGSRGAQLLVLADVSGKDPETAKQAVLKVVADSPKDPGVLVAAARYLLQSGAAGEAADLFKRTLAVDAKNSEARFGLAAVALLNSDNAAAEEQLRKIVAADKTNERAYGGLASLALKRGDRAGARTWLEQAVSAKPAAVESRLRLAEMAFADRDNARGDALIEQALSITSARAATLRQAGGILMRASRTADALERFKEAAGLGLKAANVEAAEALLQLGRVSEAQQLLESVLREQPASFPAYSALVRADLSQKRFDQALARIAAFEKAGGTPAAVAGLRAHTLETAGRRAEALQAYERFAKLQPSAPATLKIYELRRASEAPAPETVLTDWLKAHPKDASVRVALAQHYTAKGNRAAAIAQYEQAAQVSKQPELLNNLAWLYFEAGDARALEMARTAYTAAPKNAEIADTYGWILLGQGKAVEALEILQAAALAQPSLADLQYHYASALARTGKTKEAANALRKVLAEARAFPSRREAETLLNSLT
jgi:putative PEP-CTERM system TPR-repeat lipoprotein